MDQATKDKLKAAGLEGVITAFDTLKTTADKAVADLVTANATITDKEGKIAQQALDLTNLRKSTEKEYKKLADMTEVEKNAMSEKERELQERQESHEAEVALFKKEQGERAQKEVSERKSKIFGKYAGKDPELLKKLEDSFSKIIDHDKAQTETEIDAIALNAFNMLGVPKPDALREVINGGDGGVGDPKGTGFAETKEGQGLASAMGLPEAPKA